VPKPRKWKRKKPKSGRGGCLLCKPWKHQRADDPPIQERRARIYERLERKELMERY